MDAKRGTMGQGWPTVTTLGTALERGKLSAAKPVIAVNGNRGLSSIVFWSDPNCFFHSSPGGLGLFPGLFPELVGWYPPCGFGSPVGMLIGAEG